VKIIDSNPGRLLKTFGEQVVTGSVLFDNNCASCHGTSFSNPIVDKANNDLAVTYTDKGFGDTFDTPSLEGVVGILVVSRGPRRRRISGRSRRHGGIEQAALMC